MDSSFAIREAEAADAKAVSALWNRLVREHEALDERFVIADDALERWLNDYPHWVEDELHCILIAEDDDRVVGFIHGQCWEEPPVYASVPEVFIAEIYVLSAYRGQGIGTALLEALKTWSRSQTAVRLRLGVLARNAEGLAFWDKMQGEPISVTFTIDLEKKPASTAPKQARRIGF